LQQWPLQESQLFQEGQLLQGKWLFQEMWPFQERRSLENGSYSMLVNDLRQS
jgi:hypothetical protein